MEKPITTWAQLPGIYKVPKRPKQATFLIEKGDKGLADVLRHFISKDTLRPKLTGINFDEIGAIATDAYKLAIIPGKVKSKGLFDTAGNVIKENGNIVNFPDYKAVMPRDGAKYTVNLLALKTYCTALMQGGFTPLELNMIAFKTNEYDIGFNAEHLVQVCDFFLKQDIETVNVFTSNPSRGVAFTPEKENPSKPVEPYALLMPMMLKDEYFNENEATGFSDWNVHFSSKFDFATGKVDGIEIDLTLEKATAVPYGITNEEFAELRTFHGKGSTVLPIVDFAKVENRSVYVMNDKLNAMVMKGAMLKDGLYRFTKLSLLPNEGKDEINDFPKVNESKAVVKTSLFAMEGGEKPKDDANIYVNPSDHSLEDYLKLMKKVERHYGEKWNDVKEDVATEIWQRSVNKSTRIKQTEPETEPTEAEVLDLARVFQSERSLKSQTSDAGKENKHMLDATPENLFKWMRNPGKYDLKGIDNKKAA